MPDQKQKHEHSIWKGHWTMHPPKRLFFLMFTLLLIISCNQQKEKRNNENIQVISIKEQKIYKRNFKNIKIEKTIHFKSKNVYHPIMIRVDDDEDIYLYDLSVQKIKMLKNEKTINFGEGIGKGPREFTNIVDYRINNDTVYIADNQLKKISTFKKNGVFITTKNLNFSIHRILILRNKIVISSGSTSSDKYFMLLDKKFNLIKNFGNRIDMVYPASKRLFFSEGNLCTDGVSRIFYAFAYHGLILSFDIKTDKFSYVYTIDKTPMPKIETFANGRFARAPKEAPISCLSLSYDNGKLYVLSLAGEGIDKTRYTVFDVYSAQTVKYEYSFKIPARLNRAVVKNNVIYAIVNKINIMCWRIKKNSI